ncbi:MAG: response regulator [Endomicrobia bacterium]|nr:response regulator [Endomicrobiia bacterium]MDW8055774.1 response regulator [Elusimicrobiota bacterium]
MPAILIVEDDPTIAELIAERLKNEGYEVYIAFTGKDGLKYMDESNPACITLDIHLPDISGVEVLKEVRQKKEHSLPVIIITSDETARKDVEPYSPEAFFKKPVDFQKLKNVIKNVIEEKKKNLKSE